MIRRLSVLMILVILFSQSGFSATVSHSASQVNSGTFGIGNYTFPDFLVITGNVGIGITQPTEKMNISGNIGAIGNITADYFLGNGSLLTGISSGTDTNVSLNYVYNGTQFIGQRATSTGIVQMEVNYASVDTAAGSFTVANDLTVDTDTLFVDSSNNRVGIGTTGPDSALDISGTGDQKLTIQSTDQVNASIYLQRAEAGSDGYADFSLNNNAGVFKLQTHRNSVDVDALTVLWGGNVGIGTTSPNEELSVVGDVNITGNLRMQSQPAFLVTPASNQNNIAADSSDVTVVFGTEITDQGNDFASNTFTAPVTGNYFLSYAISLVDIDTAADYYYVEIQTSNRNYRNQFDPGVLASDPTSWTLTASVLADMDVGDTATLIIQEHSSGAQQTDITTQSRFSGFLAN